MDSGNSGSLQSSSGGDDQEYDSSRADQLSNFFNINPLSSSSSVPNTHHHQPTAFFDLPSSSTHYLNVNVINHSPLSLIISRDQPHPLPPNPPLDHQGVAASHSRPLPTASSSPSDLHHHHLGVMNKNASHNPKKKTRASRRAPTTVLTTDTTNFRAMVQEFTGIPRAPPFSSGHTFPSRSRFDLFRSSGRNLESLFPFRPQKMQAVTPPSSLSSSPLSLLNHSVTVDATNAAAGAGGVNGNNNYNHEDDGNNNNTNVITSTAASMVGATMNYNHLVLDPDLGLNKLQPLNMLLNLQNHNVQTQASSSSSSFQSLLLLHPDHHHHHHRDHHDPLDELRHVNANHGGTLHENHRSSSRDADNQGLRNFDDQTRD